MPSTLIPTPILTQVVGGESAFWDSSLFTSMLPLLGVIIGAVLVFIFNRAQDERRATRERLQRWDQNVLNHTSSVIGLTKRLRSAAIDFRTVETTMASLAVDQMKRGEPIDLPPVHNPALDELMESFEALAQECDLLELVAPPTVREATKHVQVAAQAVVRAKDAVDGREAGKEVRNASDVLGNTVREYFGIQK